MDGLLKPSVVETYRDETKNRGFHFLMLACIAVCVLFHTRDI